MSETLPFAQEDRPGEFPPSQFQSETSPAPGPTSEAERDFWGDTPVELTRQSAAKTNPATVIPDDKRDFWGDLPATQFQTGLGTTKPRESLSLGDIGTTFWGGTIGMGEDLAGAVQYITGHGGELRDALKKEREYQVSKLSPESQSALQSSLFGGPDSFWDQPMRAMVLKAANMAPQLVGAVLPGSVVARAVATVAGRAAGAAAGAATIGSVFGATTTGEVFGAISDEVENTPDDRLKSESPFYKRMRDNDLSEIAAKEQLVRTAAGLKPLYAGAIAALAAGLSESALGAHLFGHGAVTGVLQGVGRGAGQGVATMAPMAAASEIFGALGMRDATGRPLDWKQIISNTLEAGLSGAALGAATGMFAKRVPRAAARTPEGISSPVGVDEAAALRETGVERATQEDATGATTAAAVEHPDGPTIDEVRQGEPPPAPTPPVAAGETPPPEGVPVVGEPSAAQPAGAVAPTEAGPAGATLGEHVENVNGGAPEEFVRKAQASGVAQPDPTVWWFLDGDKPVYMPPSDPAGGVRKLGDVAGGDAPRFQGFSAVDSPQGPIFYKPGEAARAQRIAELIHDAYAGRIGGDPAREAAYHVELGKLLGYDPTSIQAYVRARGLPEVGGGAGEGAEPVARPASAPSSQEETPTPDATLEPVRQDVTPQSNTDATPKISTGTITALQQQASGRLAGEIHQQISTRPGLADLADIITDRVMAQVTPELHGLQGGVSEILAQLHQKLDVQSLLGEHVIRAMAERDAFEQSFQPRERTTENKVAPTRLDEDWRTTFARAQKIVEEQGKSAPQVYRDVVAAGRGERGGSPAFRQARANRQEILRRAMVEWEERQPKPEATKPKQDVMDTSGRLSLNEQAGADKGKAPKSLFDEDRPIAPVRKLTLEELKAEQAKLEAETPKKNTTRKPLDAPSPFPAIRGRASDANLGFIATRSLIRDMRDGKYYQPIGRGRLRDFITQFTKSRMHGNPGFISHFDVLLRDKLRDVVGDTPVMVLTDADFKALRGEGIAGVFVPGRFVDVAAGVRGAIILPEWLLNAPEYGRTEIILHEGVHAATMHALHDNKALRNDTLTLMQDVVGAVGKWIHDHPDRNHTLLKYAFQNPDEFMAVGFSNKNTQEFLQSIVTKPPRPELSVGVLRRGWDRFVGIVREALGWDEGYTNALSQLITLGSHAFETTRELRARIAQTSGLGWNVDIQFREDTPAEGVSALRHRRHLQADDWIVSRRPLDMPVAFGASPNTSPLASVARAVGDHIQDLLTNAAPALRKGMLGLTTRRQLVDTYNHLFDWLTETLPNRVGAMRPMEQASRSLAQREQVARGMRAEVEPMVRRLSQFADTNPEMSARMGKLMVDATNARVHPDAPLTDAVNNHLKRNTPDNIWSREQHPILAAEFHALSPEARQLYTDQRNWYTRNHALVREELMHQLVETRFRQAARDYTRSNPAVGPMAPWDVSGMARRFLDGKATQADKDLIGERFTDQLTTVRKLSKVDGPYFPLRRHGDYVVPWKESAARENVFPTKADAEDFARNSPLQVTGSSVRHYDASGKLLTAEEINPHDPTATPVVPARSEHIVTVQNRGLRMFDRRSDAEKFRQQLLAMGSHTVQDVQRRRYADQDVHLLPQQMQALLHSTQQMGLSAHEQEHLRGLIENTGLQLANNGMIRQSLMLRRTNVIGANTDALRGFASYATASANMRARMKFGRTINDALDAMDVYLRDRAGEGQDRSILRQDVLAEMQGHARMDAVWQPRGYSRVMQVLHQLTYLNFLASPSQTIVNSLQSVMITAPYLAARYGAKSLPELMRAYSMVGPRSLLGAGLKDFAERMKDVVGRTSAPPESFLALVMDEVNKSSAPDAARLTKMLQHVADEGLIDQHFGQDIYRATTPAGKGTKLQQLVDVSWAVPAAVEVLNRSTTAIAAFRLEMDRSGNFNKAQDAATQAVHLTQFDYSGSNAARFFDPRRHPFLQAPLMFKKWVQGIYYLLGRHAVQAFKGETPQERAEAIKTLGGVLMAHMLMAGALGLPTEPIKLAMGAYSLAMGQDKPTDWETYLRQNASNLFGPAAAEVMMMGLPHALGGDMNMKVGLNGLLLQQDLRDFKPESVSNVALQYLAGRPAGFLTGGLNAYQAYQNGDYTRMAEYAMPKIVRDLVRTGRFADQGVATRKGGQIAPVDPVGLIWQATGFQPAAVEEAYAGRNAILDARDRYTQGRNHVLTQILNTDAPAMRNELRQRWNDSVERPFRITYEQMAKALQAQHNAHPGPFGVSLPQKQRFLYEQGAFANQRG